MFCEDATENGLNGYEAWAIGKMLSDGKIIKEAIYRVLSSLWFTKEPISFVELEDGIFLVKFERADDREKILSMVPWLFDQYLLSLVPFEKDKSPSEYDFSLVPYWIRIHNVPLECMDRNVALEVG